MSFICKQDGENNFAFTVIEVQDGKIESFTDLEKISKAMQKKMHLPESQKPVILYWREME